MLVEDHGNTCFLAGDASYNERLMLAGEIDGVCTDDDITRATVGAIRQFARGRPTIYLPTHDPESASRLSHRRFVPMNPEQH